MFMLVIRSTTQSVRLKGNNSYMTIDSFYLYANNQQLQLGVAKQLILQQKNASTMNT